MVLRKLIVNADDFGMSSTINKAIAVAFRAGKISCASITPVGPKFQEAVEIAKANRIPVGLHSVIGASPVIPLKPITENKRMALGANGTFPENVGLYNESHIDDIVCEITTQLYCLHRTGLGILHWDSHRFDVPGSMFGLVVEEIQNQQHIPFVSYGKGALSKEANSKCLLGTGAIMGHGNFSFDSMRSFIEKTCRGVEHPRTWMHLSSLGGNPRFVNAFKCVMEQKYDDILKSNGMRVHRFV